MCTQVCCKNTAFRHRCMLKWLAACYIPWVRGQLYKHRNFNDIGKSQCKTKHLLPTSSYVSQWGMAFSFFHSIPNYVSETEHSLSVSRISAICQCYRQSVQSSLLCHLYMTWAPSAAEAVRPHRVLFFVFSSWNLLFEALFFVLFHLSIYSCHTGLFLVLFPLIWGGSSYLWFLCSMEIHSWKTHPVKYLIPLSM